ncbi:hypothetical protein ColTof4_08641 [Colletotrichum tofieldiae]|uniref:Uncharacterized protein n=1 Tax=Colletotrichum tofieldiae TaxID=708197 RepID=A0A166P5Q2_9PEZI|nr:hypothetical protein CT0861_05159 [Colletotrichum tofieldiae]GKT56819.1 hypothetical protein ColTof3_04158 [Colletotrichum tofieldiae]GKT76218.1 hypothetical protein ColTof4_08641 [Colletotrichum tofieldiae]
MVCRRQSNFSRALLGLLSLCAVPAQADYFTEPPSFELDRVGTRYTVPDLNTTYTLGQKVQITWEVPTVSYISLSLVHWGKNAGVAVGSLITNDRNNGYYTWYIGHGDGVTADTLAANPNFALRIIDPTGNYTKTGDPEGFIDNELQSRGFVIRANATASAVPTAVPSAVLSGAPSGVSTGAVAGIAVGCVAAGALAMLGVWLLFFRKRRPASNPTEDHTRHHPTPTLHPVMRHETRQDSAYASPNSSGDHMFIVPPAHGSSLSHQVSNISPVSPVRRHTPPPSYELPMNEQSGPNAELSGVRGPQEVSAANPNYPPELSSSHRY